MSVVTAYVLFMVYDPCVIPECLVIYILDGHIIVKQEVSFPSVTSLIGV